MYPFVVCFCGRALGDIYDVFKIMRRAKYSAAYGDLEDDFDPSLIALNEAIQVDLTDVFDSLGIHMDCCRIRLNTQVEFKELY